MKKILLSCLYLALACVLSIFLLEDSLLRDISLADSFSNLSNWHSAINFEYNAYFTWQLPKYLSKIPDALFTENYQPISAAVFLLSIIFCLGLTALLFELSENQQLIYLFSISLCLSTLLVLIFGIERVVIPSLAFLPWLSWTILRYLKEDAKSNTLLFLLFLLSLLVSQCANQFGLLIAAFALLIAMLSEAQINRKKTALFLLVLFVPQVIKLFTIPLPDFPNYPASAHVIADDGLLGNLHAFFGAEPTIQSIDRMALKNLFFKTAFVIFLFGTLSCLLLSKKDKVSKNFCGLSVLLSALILLDIVPAESFAQLMPIASLSRIIPNYLFFPLVTFFLAFALISSTIYLLRSENLLMLTLFIFSLSFFSLKIAYIDSRSLHPEIRALSREHKKLMLSPSLALIKREGIFILDEKEKIMRTRAIELPFKARFSSDDFLKPEVILNDRNPKTRLAEMTGKQTGKEWLELSFAEDTTLDGIELSVGAFRNDFPRALRIFSAKDCDKHGAHLIYETKDFQGPVLFTSDDYPYYGDQSQVKIIFNHGATTNCLRIEQTANRAPFDWSIAEVRFFQFR